jgi:hypothetical protein
VSTAMTTPHRVSIARSFAMRIARRRRAGQRELRLREVHVRVSEPRRPRGARAIEHGRLRRHRDLARPPHRTDPISDHDRDAVADGRGGGRWIEARINNGERPGPWGVSGAGAARDGNATADLGETRGGEKAQGGETQHGGSIRWRPEARHARSTSAARSG